MALKKIQVTWNVRPRWLVGIQFTWHNVPEDFNLHLTPSNSWLLCKYLQIFLQGLCVMFLLYVNHISCSRQACRYNLQVVESIIMCPLFCVLFFLYTTHIICMCENENSLYAFGDYFDLNVHFITEKRCILFRNCATESCFKCNMHYYFYVF